MRVKNSASGGPFSLNICTLGVACPQCQSSEDLEVEMMDFGDPPRDLGAFTLFTAICPRCFFEANVGHGKR